MTVSELKNQCCLWVALGKYTEVANLNVLKGSASKRKAELLESLSNIILSNCDLNTNELQNGHSESENESCSSSSDEEDTQLA